MMPDGVEQQRIPRISGVQFPVAGLLQKHLYFFVIQFQTERQRDHLVPGGIFPAEKNLIHIGFIQVGTAYYIGFGAVLLFQPALQIFRQAVKLHFTAVLGQIVQNVVRTADLMRQFICRFHGMPTSAPHITLIIARKG